MANTKSTRTISFISPHGHIVYEQIKCAVDPVVGFHGEYGTMYCLDGTDTHYAPIGWYIKITQPIEYLEKPLDKP